MNPVPAAALAVPLQARRCARSCIRNPSPSSAPPKAKKNGRAPAAPHDPAPSRRPAVSDQRARLPLLGLPAYPSLMARPGPVDLAILLVPRDHARRPSRTRQQGHRLRSVSPPVSCRDWPAGRAAEEITSSPRRAAPACVDRPQPHGADERAPISPAPPVVMGTVQACRWRHRPCQPERRADGRDAVARRRRRRRVPPRCRWQPGRPRPERLFEYLIDDPATEVVRPHGRREGRRALHHALVAPRRPRPASRCIAVGRSEAGGRAAAFTHTASLAGAWPASRPPVGAGARTCSRPSTTCCTARRSRNAANAAPRVARRCSRFRRRRRTAGRCARGRGPELPLFDLRTREALAPVLPPPTANCRWISAC